MRNDILKNKKGFSLVETLIAVSILMIAIAGPLALVQAGLFSSNHERNEVTATYLAQEALEYLKNFRDSNAYTQYDSSPVDWLTGPGGVSLLSTCADPTGCYVDPHGKLPGNALVQSVTPGVTLLLYQNTNANGVFSYSYDKSVGTPTSYNRVVTIKQVTGTTDEVTVTVSVNWLDNLLARNYTVSTNLFNYQIADVSDNGNPGGGQGGGGDNNGGNGNNGGVPAAVAIGTMHSGYDNGNGTYQAEPSPCSLSPVYISSAEGFQQFSYTPGSGECALSNITLNQSSAGYCVTLVGGDNKSFIGGVSSNNLGSDNDQGYGVSVTPGDCSSPTVPSAPVISNFAASPSSISSGGSSTLNWTSTGADSCSLTDENNTAYLDGASEPSNGSLNVVPDTTSTYDLTCTNDASGLTSAVSKATVTVSSGSGGGGTQDECLTPDINGQAGSLDFSVQPVAGTTYYVYYKDGALQYYPNTSWQLNDALDGHGYYVSYDDEQTTVNFPGDSTDYSTQAQVEAANSGKYVAITPTADDQSMGIRVGFTYYGGSEASNAHGSPDPTFCITTTQPSGGNGGGGGGGTTDASKHVIGWMYAGAPDGTVSESSSGGDSWAAANGCQAPAPIYNISGGSPFVCGDIQQQQNPLTMYYQPFNLQQSTDTDTGFGMCSSNACGIGSIYMVDPGYSVTTYYNDGSEELPANPNRLVYEPESCVQDGYPTLIGDQCFPNPQDGSNDYVWASKSRGVGLFKSAGDGPFDFSTNGYTYSPGPGNGGYFLSVAAVTVDSNPNDPAGAGGMYTGQ